MRFYINKDGNYYEGDKASFDDLEVIQRPSHLHTWQDNSWVKTLTPPPDIDGFIQAVKTGLGGIVAVNNLATLYPLFFPAVQAQNWADVNLLLADALSKSVISAAQKTAILAAATAFNIPGLA